MNYVSIGFLIFTLVCFGVYYAVPKKAKQYILLLASVVFYFLFSKYLIAASAIVTLIIYLVSLKIGKIDEDFNLRKKELSKEERKSEKKKIKSVKKKWVAVECVSAFSALIIFKYLGFFTGIINSAISLFSSFEIPVISLIMPIGISYYTLSVAGYAIDVYRGNLKPEKNFASLFLFTIYFPHIVEGPIGNYSSFSTQIKNPQKLTYDNFMRAFELILIGLVKKMVLADRAGIICSTFFDDYKGYGTATAILNMVLYTINIYFDFSGCMDIVCGVSELFGIKLPQNFRQPFFSENIQEFWRRWHITLGDWIKKYIFYSVSMSKCNQKIMTKCNNKIKSVYLKTTLPMLFALLFVWLFNGIWHGASWKYITYGMYYYVILSLGMLFEPVFEKFCSKLKINRESKSFKFFRIFRTQLLVTVGLTMFKAETLTDFAHIMKSLVSLQNPLSDLASFYSKISLSSMDFLVIAFFTAIMLFISIKKENGMDIREYLNENTRRRWILCTVAAACVIFLGVYGAMYAEQPFVYAQF